MPIQSQWHPPSDVLGSRSLNFQKLIDSCLAFQLSPRPFQPPRIIYSNHHHQGHSALVKTILLFAIQFSKGNKSISFVTKQQRCFFVADLAKIIIIKKNILSKQSFIGKKICKH
jgi:hypothetical protein